MTKTTRSLIKHVAEPHVYCIEADEDGMILNALDVTTEATSGGLCSHMLGALPLAAQIDDVEMLNRERHEFWAPFVAECGNVHHLLADLITMSREHRAAGDTYALAASRAAALKKDMELKGEKVHELLRRIADRKPLPLFESIGG